MRTLRVRWRRTAPVSEASVSRASVCRILYAGDAAPTHPSSACAATSCRSDGTAVGWTEAYKHARGREGCSNVPEQSMPQLNSQCASWSGTFRCRTARTTTATATRMDEGQLELRHCPSNVHAKSSSLCKYTHNDWVPFVILKCRTWWLVFFLPPSPLQQWPVPLPAPASPSALCLLQRARPRPLKFATASSPRPGRKLEGSRSKHTQDWAR